MIFKVNRFDKLYLAIVGRDQNVIVFIKKNSVHFSFKRFEKLDIFDTECKSVKTQANKTDFVFIWFFPQCQPTHCLIFSTKLFVVTLLKMYQDLVKNTVTRNLWFTNLNIQLV